MYTCNIRFRVCSDDILRACLFVFVISKLALLSVRVGVQAEREERETKKAEGARGRGGEIKEERKRGGKGR